jgi:F-type H+-transporting ATPase subunit alpha
MPTLRQELDRLVGKGRRGIGGVPAGPRTEHTGSVEHVGDGVALLTGLPDTRLDELLMFENGIAGMAVSLEAGHIGCVLLGPDEGIEAGGRVVGTGQVVRVPVGDALLGRVLDALGRPLDELPPPVPERMEPVERPAPAILERDLVSRPLHTGVLAIDAMIPIGRGQRELVIGDRSIGKTALVLDTIISQRNSDVICIYAGIGQKGSAISGVIDSVRRYGEAGRCIFVVAPGDSSPGVQWLAPYAACSMAEFYRDRGQDALLVIDDLTKHAAIHRQLALLLRHPPGREAYPGDVFYAHSRLLERAAQLSPEMGGGSLTALPIAETQAGNITAYIPTNLISITDGQVYLEPRLFQEGQKPAVNIGASISRVGGASQQPAMKRLAEHLRLEYAQFLELEMFTRFGAMTDARTIRTIEHGKRIRAILTQPQYAPIGLSNQVAVLLALHERLLDAVPLERIGEFRNALAGWLDEHCGAHMHALEASGELPDESRAKLLDAMRELVASMLPDGPAEQGGGEV